MRRRGTPPIIEWDERPCTVAGLKGPCHVFKGNKDRAGYGRVFSRGKTVKVHRYVWAERFGPIGKLYIDHRCRTKACCNVDHLRVVTPRVNALENSVGHAATNAAKTHCKKGHKFTPKNTRITNKGGRECRQCRLIYERSHPRYGRRKV